jgi:putative CocE/NonD family hydrolase
MRGLVSAMPQGVKDRALPAVRGGRLPWHVRFFVRQSRRGLPAPRYAVTLERGVLIPMPDGTRQVADVYRPVTGDSCPTLLVRTPYGRGFPYDFMYGGLFAEQGFHVVLASTRGTGGSGGTHEPFVDEAADGQATVAWLREQEWFNGALGTIGASYLGFTQWALAADPPPELRAMVVQVSADDFYQFLYPGGALALEATLTGVAGDISQHLGFRRSLRAVLRLARYHKRVARAYPLLRGYRPAFGRRVGYFEDWLRHPSADDPYWAPRRAEPDIKTTPPVSLLGGWYDILIDQTLDSYRRLADAGGPARLVVGPWNHTSGFNKDMPVVAGEALAWLHAHLTGPGTAPADPVPGATPVRVHVGEIGGPGKWQDLADWPPPAAVAQQWHLRADGTLGHEPGDGTSSFRYDPADPTPSVGGPRMDSRSFGPKPNNALEARDDVLTFTGEPLDAPLDVIGPVGIQLRARGSSPYFDLFARLCDVDASGVSWNVCDGLVRVSGGTGWTVLTVPMSATAHRFAAGHRLRAQVSGGAHPRFARNTGTADQIATAVSLVRVDIEISHAAISLPVMPAAPQAPAVASGCPARWARQRR